MPDDDRMDRRQFAGRLATVSGAVAVVASSQRISADEEVPKVKPNDVAKPKEAAEPEAEAEAPVEVVLLTYLVRRYPSIHLDDEALRGIFGDIRGDVARGKVLSEFPLKNSDEPAFVFQAYRSPE